MPYDHSSFVDRLKDAHRVQCMVAQWFESLNREFVAIVPRLRIAPRREEAHLFRDKGDVFLWVPQPWRGGSVMVKLKIEVHKIDYNFIDAHDWPHRWGMFVCPDYQWDRANPKPDAFVTVNLAETHAGIIWSNTQEHWRKAPAVLDASGEPRTNYLCPIEHVLFTRIKDRPCARLLKGARP